MNQQLTLLSKSSKFANPPNASGFGPWDGRGGAGRGGGCFAFFGGNAGDGDSGALAGLEPWVGAWRMANGSLPNASLPVCRYESLVEWKLKLKLLLTSLAGALLEEANGSGLLVLLPAKGSLGWVFHEFPPCHESSSPKPALLSKLSSKLAATGCVGLNGSLVGCDSLNAGKLQKK